MTTERKLGWEKCCEGQYRYRTEHCDVLVQQWGEIWHTHTYFEGTLADYGEWDSRSTAFRHARNSAKHAVRIRSPLTVAKKQEQEDDEDDE